MKQETLEEASIINYKKLYEGEPLTQDVPIDAFKQGAKWQQERSYNEEDMINASKYGYEFHQTTKFPEKEFTDNCLNNTKQWLTTFKKK